MKASGVVQEFALTLLAEAPGFAVARFVIERGAGPPRLPVTVPPQSTSDGYFWADRAYSIYRMKAPGGRLLGHRFDAVRDVTITHEGVLYHDMVVDWWVFPGGSVVEEDAEELAALVAEGVISAETAADVLAGARAAQREAPAIVGELEELERRFGVP